MSDKNPDDSQLKLIHGSYRTPPNGQTPVSNALVHPILPQDAAMAPRKSKTLESQLSTFRAPQESPEGVLRRGRATAGVKHELARF